MNPIRRLGDWLRGLFGRATASDSQPDEEAYGPEELAASFFGVLAIFAESESPVVEMSDVMGNDYYLARILSVSPEFVIFDVLDRDGAETGLRHVRSLGMLADVKLSSAALSRVRLERMYRYEPPPEEPNAHDQDDPDDPRGE